MGAGRSCCAVTDARARAASARWADCTCRASSRAARSWCVATTARPPAVSARPAPPAVRTGQCPPAPPAVRTGQCPPVPPAVRIGQCCYTRCQNGSVLLHPLSKQVSTAIRTGQYHPDPHAVRTGQYRCQNRSVPPPPSTRCQNRSVPLMNHSLSEHVSAVPPAVRKGQCCSTRCQIRSVPLSEQSSTAVRKG